MESPPKTSPSPRLPIHWALLWGLALILVFAVNNQSLWIDEACAAAKASAVSAHEWWQKMIEIGGSDLQMPFYMIYIWVFAKFFGSSEWALRAAGLLWLAPGLVAMASGFSSPSRRAAVMLAAVASAFTWYYAGEARPYAMQLGASCLIFAALHRLSRDLLDEKQQSRWLSGFLLGFLALCGSSLLGVVWSIGAVAAVFILIPRRRLFALWKMGWLRMTLAGLVLAGLGIYYLWTLSVGARATAVASTDWKTMAFVFYEQLGFTGLGPGRLELRQAGIQTLRPYFLPLAGYFLLLTILLAGGIRQAWRMGPRRTGMLALAVAVPVLLLLGVGVATHFRVLGRHFAPLMPIWFSLLALGLASFWDRGGWMAKSVAMAFVLFSLGSCLSVRFAVRHQRDDYRAAAQYAERALQQNQAVWWNANKTGAWYYHLPLSNSPADHGAALFVENPAAETLAGWPVPQWIVASKPDIFDSSGALARYIAGHNFHLAATFPAFTLWQLKE